MSTAEKFQTKEERKYFWSDERRRFVRYPCAWKIKFCDLTEQAAIFHMGRCKNLSQGGLKISSFQPLKPNAVIVIDVHPALFEKHISMDGLLRVGENKILAKVAWRHLNLETGIFEAGLEFIEASKKQRFAEEFLRASQS